MRPSADQLLQPPWLLAQKAAQRAHQQEFGLIPPPPAKDTEVPEQTMLDVDTIVRTVQLYRMAQAKRRKRFKLRQVHPARLVWLSQQTQIPLHIVQYKFKQTTKVINAALAKKRAALAEMQDALRNGTQTRWVHGENNTVDNLTTVILKLRRNDWD